VLRSGGFAMRLALGPWLWLWLLRSACAALDGTSRTCNRTIGVAYLNARAPTMCAVVEAIAQNHSATYVQWTNGSAGAVEWPAPTHTMPDNDHARFRARSPCVYAYRCQSALLIRRATTLKRVGILAAAAARIRFAAEIDDVISALFARPEAVMCIADSALSSRSKACVARAVYRVLQTQLHDNRTFAVYVAQQASRPRANSWYDNIVSERQVHAMRRLFYDYGASGTQIWTAYKLPALLQRPVRFQPFVDFAVMARCDAVVVGKDTPNSAVLFKRNQFVSEC